MDIQAVLRAAKWATALGLAGCVISSELADNETTPEPAPTPAQPGNLRPSQAMATFPEPKTSFENKPEDIGTFQRIADVLLPWSNYPLLRISYSRSKYATRVGPDGETYLSVEVRGDTDDEEGNGYLSLKYQGFYRADNRLQDYKILVETPNLPSSGTGPLRSYAAWLQKDARTKWFPSSMAKATVDLLPVRIVFSSDPDTPIPTIQFKEVRIAIITSKTASLMASFRKKGGRNFTPLPGSPFRTQDNQASIPFTPETEGDWEVQVTHGTEQKTWFIHAEPVVIDPPIGETFQIEEGRALHHDFRFRTKWPVRIAYVRESPPGSTNIHSLGEQIPDSSGRIHLSFKPLAPGRHRVIFEAKEYDRQIAQYEVIVAPAVKAAAGKEAEGKGLLDLAFVSYSSAFEEIEGLIPQAKDNELETLKRLFFDIRVSIIRIQIRRKKYDEEVTALNAFLAKYPKYVEGFFFLGWIYTAKGDYDQGIDYFKNFLNTKGEASPDEWIAKAHYYLGEAFRRRAVSNSSPEQNRTDMERGLSHYRVALSSGFLHESFKRDAIQIVQEMERKQDQVRHRK